MTATLYTGQRRWSLDESEEGWRTYTLMLQVRTDDPRDGPATVRQTPGLPLPGSFWQVDNDIDVYATCKRNVQVKPRKDDKPGKLWDLTFTYTNRPTKRCVDTAIDDPLLEPPKITVTDVTEKEEATLDRYGAPILNSSMEQLRGPQLEFESGPLQVVIEYNVAVADLGLVALMRHTVNDAPLWGFPARCVKLSKAASAKQYKGLCEVYWKRTLTFDIDPRTWDRTVMDEGTKVLRGDWDRVKTSATYRQFLKAPGVTGASQADYVQFKDWKGENCRVILDGHGLPAIRQIGGSSQALSGATVGGVATGTGYAVGNVLTLTGGTVTTAAQVVVDAIGTGGEVVQVVVVQPGVYTLAPTDPVSTTGGGGSGAKLSCTFMNVPAKVARATAYKGGPAGTGYAVGDTLLVTGGTFSKQASLVVLGSDADGFLVVDVLEPGVYTVPPVSPVAVTNASGSASGATFDLQWADYISPEQVGARRVEKYNESNFLLLGLPLDLEAP